MTTPLAAPTLHVVRWTGIFGFIKPWTAVRDGTTYSQQFLTPSILEGIRIRLEVDAIARHKLTHMGLDMQQEVVQAKGLASLGRGAERRLTRPRGVLTRGVLVRPTLTLAFTDADQAAHAQGQALCLSRAEDILWPVDVSEVLKPADFDGLDGFEVFPVEESDPDAVLLGYNRYDGFAPMYCRIEVTGAPAACLPPVTV